MRVHVYGSRVDCRTRPLVEGARRLGCLLQLRCWRSGVVVHDVQYHFMHQILCRLRSHALARLGCDAVLPLEKAMLHHRLGLCGLPVLAGFRLLARRLVQGPGGRRVLLRLQLGEEL